MRCYTCGHLYTYTQTKTVYSVLLYIVSLFLFLIGFACSVHYIVLIWILCGLLSKGQVAQVGGVWSFPIFKTYLCIFTTFAFVMGFIVPSCGSSGHLHFITLVSFFLV